MNTGRWVAAIACASTGLRQIIASIPFAPAADTGVLVCTSTYLEGFGTRRVTAAEVVSRAALDTRVAGAVRGPAGVSGPATAFSGSLSGMFIIVGALTKCG